MLTGARVYFGRCQTRIPTATTYNMFHHDHDLLFFLMSRFSSRLPRTSMITTRYKAELYTKWHVYVDMDQQSYNKYYD